MGGETERRLLELAVDTHNRFLACVESNAPAPQARSWLRRRRSGSEEVAVEPDPLISMVDTTIGDPVRRLLVQRGRAHAAITELALALEGLRGRKAN
jgi:hypothetical protein